MSLYMQLSSGSRVVRSIGDRHTVRFAGSAEPRERPILSPELYMLEAWVHMETNRCISFPYVQY